MDIKEIGSTFFIIMVAETGDNTFMIIASLSAKYSFSAILLGNQLAMTPLIIFATYLGSTLTYLPIMYVHMISVILFSIFCGLAFKECYKEYRKSQKIKLDDDNSSTASEMFLPNELTWARTVLKSTILIFLGEFGDVSQLSMIPLSMTYSKESVIIGALFAMFISAILAISIGKIVAKFISETITSGITGLIFFGFATYNLVLLIQDF